MSEIHEEDGSRPGEAVEQPGSGGKHVDEILDPVARSIRRRFEIGKCSGEIRHAIQTAIDAHPSKCLESDIGIAIAAVEQILAREIAALRYDLDDLRKDKA